MLNATLYLGGTELTYHLEWDDSGKDYSPE